MDSPRTPSPNRRSRAQNVTRSGRIRIKRMRLSGHTNREIRREYNVSNRQIRYALSHPDTPTKSTGRPPKLDERLTDEIIAFVRASTENRQLSFLDLAVRFGCGVKALRKGLRKRGYKRYRALPRPYLSEANKRQRLVWAQEHLSWSDEMWRRVLWSDETWTRSTRHKGVRVTRMQGEELEETCLVLKPAKKIGWMFWGSIQDSRKGPCLVWDKSWGSISNVTYRAHTLPLVYEHNRYEIAIKTITLTTI
jgi:hypothetical protein